MKAKRLLSAILCIAMVLGTMSFTVFAETISTQEAFESAIQNATEGETIQLADGTYTMPTNYDSFNEAWQTAMNKSGNISIRLLSDAKYDLTSLAANDMSAKNITIDLNNRDLTIAEDLVVGGGFYAGNTLTFTGTGNVAFTNNSSIELESDCGADTLIINSGNFINQNTSATMISSKWSNHIIKFNGGTYTGKSVSIANGTPVITKADDVDVASPEGYIWQDNKAVKEPPVVAKIGDTKYYSLADAIKFANEAEDGTSVTITLEKDITLDDWTPIAFNNNITLVVDGNEKTITGLNAPLFSNVNAPGLENVTIKDLTFENVNISSTADAAGTVVGWYEAHDSNDTLLIENVHVNGGSISGSDYVGGLVGYTSAVNENGVKIVNSSVKNVTLTGGGSTGSVVGHSDKIIIEDTVVGSNVINTNDTNKAKVGVVAGTLNSGAHKIDVTEETKSTSDSTLNVLGRALSAIEITGGSYFTDPTVASLMGAGANLKPSTGFVIEASANGMFGLKKGGNITRTIYNANDNALSCTIFNAYPTESVVVELYSNGEKIATTTLLEENYFQDAASELTCQIKIKPTTGDAWNTVWENGNPADIKEPDTVVLYIDGEKVAENEVTFYGNMEFEYGGTQEAVWADFKDIIKVEASISSTSTTAVKGDTVYVSVNTSDLSDTFNASEFEFTFTNNLEFDKDNSALGDALTSAKDNALKVIQFGNDRNYGDGVYTLAFKTVGGGEANVTLTRAAIGDVASAETRDLTELVIAENKEIVTITVSLPVELDDIFAGEDTVDYGSDYTFGAETVTGNYYDYALPTATIGGGAATVIDNGDGTWTVENVTDDLVITGTRTEKKYAVTINGETKANDGTEATYNTDYNFTLADDIPASTAVGYTYELESVTIGGVAYVGYAVSDRTYTIIGANITGDIVVTVKKTEVAPNQFVVNITGDGAGAAKLDKTVVDINDSVTLTINPEAGYEYKVTVDGTELTGTDNKYTVDNVTKTVEFVVTRSVIIDNVKISEYLTLDGTTMWLVINETAKLDGKVYTYKGQTMYWSNAYNAYATLVVAENEPVIAASDFAIIAGNVTVIEKPELDVNMSEKVDTNDAQLVWNMYNAKYSDFTANVTVEKFLRADTNSDKVVNMMDTSAIAGGILK